MTTDRTRVLAVAVASRKIAFVLLINGQLKDWQQSRAAGMSAPKGRSFLRMAVARLKPDLVVIENPYGQTRKYGVSSEILMAMAQDLVDGAVPHRLVRRTQAYANKYAEAAALAERYPEIAPWLPTSPKLWQTEPIETIYFEALALAEEVMNEMTGDEDRQAK
jgi:hypothetical protein